MEYIYKKYYRSPIGLVEVAGKNEGIISVNFVDDYSEAPPINDVENVDLSEENQKAAKNVNECIKQLDEYYKGKRKAFHIDMALEGTEFQKKVWKALKNIPYGTVVSYGSIADETGNKKAARAVGNANNKNPISVIIPCHRVIGNDGSLTGYGGGLWRKKWLLEHEGVSLK